MSQDNNQSRKWLVLYTKPRNEKKVAERLSAQGFEAYCPMYTTLRQWSDRKKKVSLPAIPSYVFISLSENERYQVLQDPGVLNFVYWLKKPAVVRDEEIQRLKHIIEGAGLEDEVTAEAWRPGDRVVLESGPFEGWQGNIQHAKKKEVAVVLETLGIVVKVKPVDVAKA